MKIIKFRAYDKENKNYIYNIENSYDTGYGAQFLSDSCKPCIDDSEDFFGKYLDNTKRYSIDQFVCYDHDNLPIYENDYVMTEFGRIYQVVFKATTNFIGYTLKNVYLLENNKYPEFTLEAWNKKHLYLVGNKVELDTDKINKLRLNKITK